MWSERVYASLPIALQNAAVSLQGGQFQAVRYLSRSFRETTRVLKENERLSLRALKEIQFGAFRELMTHCYANSPFYRRLWQSHGVHPDDIRSLADLRSIPMVSKQDLRRYTEEFYTEKVRRSMTAVHSSGTTGSPITVHFSNQDIGRRFAFLERCRRWAGVHIGQKRATFTGRNIVPRSAGPFWRHNLPGRQLLFSSYHLSLDNLAWYVEALARFQPVIIDGYPSAIHIVAEHLLRSGRAARIRPQAILVSAETVFCHQREAIEAAFQTKLYNQYASSEGAPFVSECKYGRLHIHLDSGVIEILDPEGDPVSPGQIGQLVVSSFTTSVVPLLRFAIGDMAIPSEDQDPCPCGLPFPAVDALVGRVDDVLCTPDRGFVGRLDTVFKGVPSSIVEAQIVQISPEVILLRVVPDLRQYRPEHARQIVEQMRSKLGEVVTIDVEEVRSIPRSANGKMRPVVNLCGDLLPRSLQYDKLGSDRERPFNRKMSVL